jgi:hypothetical protein
VVAAKWPNYMVILMSRSLSGLMEWNAGWFSAPHSYATDRIQMVLSGTWWVNSGADFTPDLAIPVPTGGFVKRTAQTFHFGGVPKGITEPRGHCVFGIGLWNWCLRIQKCLLGGEYEPTAAARKPNARPKWDGRPKSGMRIFRGKASTPNNVRLLEIVDKCRLAKPVGEGADQDDCG